MYAITHSRLAKTEHAFAKPSKLNQGWLSAPTIEWASGKVAKCYTGLMTCKASLCRRSGGMCLEKFEK